MSLLWSKNCGLLSMPIMCFCITISRISSKELWLLLQYMFLYLNIIRIFSLVVMECRIHSPPQHIVHLLDKVLTNPEWKPTELFFLCSFYKHSELFLSIHNWWCKVFKVFLLKNYYSKRQRERITLFNYINFFSSCFFFVFSF